MALLIFHSSCIGYVLSLVRMGFHGTFKLRLPFFWYPAHTITFLLPGEVRVLFAAILGVVLGVLLAVAARMK